MMQNRNGIRTKLESLRPALKERVRRQWAAAEAMALGRGGIATVARATGLARNTIVAGIPELEIRPDEAAPEMQVHRNGGGRKKLTGADQEFLEALEALVDPVTRGDPESPL